MKNILFASLLVAVSLGLNSCDAKGSTKDNSNTTNTGFAESRWIQETQYLKSSWVLRNVVIVLNPNLGNEQTYYADEARVFTRERGNIQLIFVNKEDNKIYYIQNHDFCITKN